MKYENFSEFYVRATTAEGAIPIENCIVHISGADENNRLENYSLMTDVDGITPKIILRAPSKELSMSPNAKEVPYALYDIAISHPNYYSKFIKNVAVFADTVAVLPINMLPFNEEKTVPQELTDSTVEENMRLQ